MSQKPKVYIETSIPSFYYEDRADSNAVARREWTRKWWDDYRHLYQVVSSQAVLVELSAGDYSKKDKCVAFLDNISFVPIEPEVAVIVQTYLQHKVMPQNAGGDALHLALASYHKCDILLTWNCKHIANANKFAHIRQINTLLGLYVPILTTPLELLGEIA